MITISTTCSFAAYDNNTKKLASSIIIVGAGTTLLCNQDELNVSGKDTAFLQLEQH